MPTPSLSPIATQCDPIIASKLHITLPSLLKLDSEGEIQHDEWKHV